MLPANVSRQSAEIIKYNTVAEKLETKRRYWAKQSASAVFQDRFPDDEGTL